MSAADDDLIGTWVIAPFADDSFTGTGFILGCTGSFNVYVDDHIEPVSLSYISTYDGYFTGEPCYVGLVLTDSQGYSQSSNYLTGTSSKITVNKGTAVTYSDSEDFYTELRTITIDSVSTPTDSDAYIKFARFLELYGTKQEPPPEPSLLDNILGTFSEVGSWIGTIISSLVALFWSVETASLTFLGILSVAGLAFSVIMLLFSFVTRFVGFSG